MNDDIKKLMTEQLAQMRANYLVQLPQELASLKVLADNLLGCEADRNHLEELHYRLHKLAGSGGTFGLTTLSTMARQLELRVKSFLELDLDQADVPRYQAFQMDLAALDSRFNETASPDSATAADATPEDQGSTQIWIIDSDQDFGKELAVQLSSFNYQTRGFNCLADALSAAASNCPEILLLTLSDDTTEEDISNLSALKKSDCALLLLRSKDDFSSRLQGARLGASGYFLKPVDIPHLVNRITQIIDRRHAPPSRVLIVDDDIDLAHYLRMVLMAAGMEAEVLEHPEEMMNTISAFRPELILMDMYMPQASGPELASVIRQHERWSSLPIVYLSAETDLDQQFSALNHGADDFLTKPITDTHLIAAVRVRVERARQLEQLITRDSLTGLLKHASIKDAADVEILRGQRHQTPVCIAMLDIDHFKKVNDNYGHAIGDMVISSVATLLRQRLRQSDIIGRYGGEEFVVVLSECTLAAAHQLLEEIRQRFSQVRFTSNKKNFYCTISAGLVCSSDFPQKSSTELLNKADEALYCAKNGGRNKVCTAALSVVQKDQ